jgi:NhaP-type Na+/H+ or K+/H+ antiporter
MTSSYLILITVIGIAALGMAWIPYFTERTNISYSIVYVLAGALLYSITDTLPFPDPLQERETVLRLTEMVVIISLMGTGLKIDQPFSVRSWKVPFRLVTITMVLSIAAVAILSKWIFGLDVAGALLLGAVLAPTDPVLASDVQVGPPLEKNKDNVRFSLTAEAGMNDGMAFPFTWLAIAWALSPVEFDLQQWILRDLILKLIIGLVCGYLLGKALAFLVFKVSKDQDIYIRDGFVAICATFITYGITEMLHGYGFIAVFVSAISIRNYELHHDYHRKLHSFTDQIERILLAIVLILFGGSLIHVVIQNISWSMVIFSLLCIFLVRPITAWLSLYSLDFHRKEKRAISFFGIKGIGSFFYLAFALQSATFEGERLLWSVVSCVVLFSIIIHGVTASFSMKKLGDQFQIKNEIPEKKPDERE